jgi:predicted dehydrogenase
MKVGIVGVGFMGSTHAEAWSQTDAHIIGMVSESTDETRPVADQYGTKTYPNFESLLKDVDVIDICAPTHLHYEMVLRAADAGKTIICEKPLARTVEQAAEMVSDCRRAGVQLLVAHVVRFFPEYALAKSSVDQGQIGKPGVVRLTRGSYRPKKPVGNWFLDEEKSGGILMDLMIHDFDFARWIAGEVESVFAKKVSTDNPDAPIDYGLAVLKHKSGTLSHIAGAWAYPPSTFRTHIEIAGDAGLIELDSDVTAPIHTLLAKESGSDAPDVGLPSNPLDESPYTTQIKEFHQTLVEGSKPRVSAEDGLAAVQIAQAAIQSASSETTVFLNSLQEDKS